MTNARQLSFLTQMKISSTLAHGGDARTGKRKVARPLDPKRPVHVTLRSHRARGSLSLLNPKHSFHVERATHALARKWGIRVYRFVNVGNHIHLVIRTRSKKAFQAFLRETAGRIAVLVTGARKGAPQGKFWEKLAWSRVLSWGGDFRNVMRYLIKNIFEAEGLLSRQQKRDGVRIVSLQWHAPPLRP